MAVILSIFQLFLLCLEWLHARTVGPLVDWLDEGLLGAWEESVKLFVREFFTTATRLINGTCAWALALSDSNYRQSLRCTWQQKEAWHSWWREERQSTLNAVLAAQCPAPAGPRHVRRASDISTSYSRSHKHTGHISWQQQQQSSPSGSSSSKPGSLSVSQPAATAAADVPPASPRTAAANRGSWVARLVWKLEVDLLGRSEASPAVKAAATGASTNPLLQRLPSMPSLPSFPSMNSLQSLASLPAGLLGSCDNLTAASNGQGSAAACQVQGLGQAGWDYLQQQQQQQQHFQGVGNSSSSSSGRRARVWLMGLWCSMLALPLLPLQWLLAAINPFAARSRNHPHLQQQQQENGQHFHSAPSEPYQAEGRGHAAAAAAVGRGGRGVRAPRRSIIFEMPSGFGVHEGSKRRGLIEELCLAGELCVTAVFDAMRWVVRVLTLTRPRALQRHPSMTAAAATAKQQRRLAAAAAATARQQQQHHDQQQQARPAHVRPGSPVAAAKAGKGSSRWLDDGDIDEQQQEREQLLVPGVYSCNDSSSSSSSSDDEGSARGRCSVRANRLLQRSKSVGADLAELRYGTARGSSALPRLTLRRVRSVGRWTHDGHTNSSSGGGGTGGVGEVLLDGVGDDDELSAAAQMIIKAGYPLELHCVTTADGYILRMERIPRTGCGRVAFFLHGILDTSLTWVSSGVTGSQAFAAWDQGFDVWLGSSRSNPPRLATDPAKQGLAYFNFSLNELGIHDIPAQLDHLHAVKMREIAGSGLLAAVTAVAGGSDSLRHTSRQQGVGGSAGTAAAAAAAAGCRLWDPLLTGRSAAAGGVAPAGPAESVFAAAAAVAVPGSQAAGEDSGQRQRRLDRSLTRSYSEPQLDRLVSEALAAAARDGSSAQLFGGPDSSSSSSSKPGGRKRMGAGIGALGRMIKSAVTGGKNKQQQQQQQQGGSSEAAAGMGGGSKLKALLQRRSSRHGTDHPSCTDSGTNSTLQEEQQQQQVLLSDVQQQQAELMLPSSDVLSHAGGVAGAAAAAAAMPTACEALEVFIPEVREPSTPEVAESPLKLGGVCPAAAAAIAAAAAAAAAAAVAAGSSRRDSSDSSEADLQPEQQQQQVSSVSPFTSPAVQQAAAAALVMDAADTDAVELSSSSSWQQQQQEKDDTAAASSNRTSSGSSAISSSSSLRRSQSSQALMSIARHSYPLCGRGSGGSGVLGASSSNTQQGSAGFTNQVVQQDVLLNPGRSSSSGSGVGNVFVAGDQDNATCKPPAAAVCQPPRGANSRGSSALPPRPPSAAAAMPPPLQPPAAAAPAAPAAAPSEPYELRVVAHSLGGASMLMYLVMRAAAGQAHHVRRLILMSPAGFHHRVPSCFWPFIVVLPWWHWLLVACVGRHRAYHPAVLPTYIGRALTFSYFLEIARLPALADFSRAVMKGFFGGDASQWERALLMPHYNATGMPACSLHQALHFIQIIRTGRFRMFDYGSAAANTARYGTPRPPDIGAQYWRLAGVHVDLCAGSGDGIIPPSNVLCHYHAMKEQGLQVSYREFAYGHMDFTFSVKDELRYYVLQCLNKRN